jgi:hypothetical protein
MIDNYIMDNSSKEIKKKKIINEKEGTTQTSQKAGTNINIL